VDAPWWGSGLFVVGGAFIALLGAYWGRSYEARAKHAQEKYELFASLHALMVTTLHLARAEADFDAGREPDLPYNDKEVYRKGQERVFTELPNIIFRSHFLMHPRTDRAFSAWVAEPADWSLGYKFEDEAVLDIKVTRSPLPAWLAYPYYDQRARRQQPRQRHSTNLSDDLRGKREQRS
jgi:hypothetical protein